MTSNIIISDSLRIEQSGQGRRSRVEDSLPARITRASSQQTYYTIRLLADRNRVQDAYRAYAYFRWLDDTLDGGDLKRYERIAFVERQQSLMDGQHTNPRGLAPEERMLLRLIASDPQPDSGLQAYVRNMMAVMSFDAQRRGRLISQQELADYTRHLAIGVTEALHYFIGHDDPAPHTQARYYAVTAAHITHMLRDTFEDIAAGYFNIPHEFLDAQRIVPRAVESDAYRQWVKSRVQLARDFFKAGRAYTAQVGNLRRRLAGYAYIARFEWMLDTIEREDYRLRPEYPERKSLRAALNMGRSALTDSLNLAAGTL